MRRLASSSGISSRALALALFWSAFAILGTIEAVQAQPPTVRERLRVVDTTRVQILTMRDGSRLVGRITSIDESELVFRAGKNTLNLSVADVVAIREMSADEYAAGNHWFPHPHQTHFVLGPTGRTLPRGEGYFALNELFFPSLNYGITNYLTFGGGATLVPGLPLRNQLVYLLPKVAVVRTGSVNVAVGALVFRATDLFADDGSADPFGIAYGVATFGGPDANITTGFGLPFHGEDLASRPLVQFGGQFRFAARGALITENWAYRTWDDTQWISWTGFRFLAETVSFDAAIMFMPGEEEWLPWVGFTTGF